MGNHTSSWQNANYAKKCMLLIKIATIQDIIARNALKEHTQKEMLRKNSVLFVGDANVKL